MAEESSKLGQTPKRSAIFQRFFSFVNRQSPSECDKKTFPRSGSDHAIQVHSTAYYPVAHLQLELKPRGTPPLAVFSSDEDICTTPGLPKPRPQRIEIIEETTTNKCKSAPTTPSLRIKHSTQASPSKPQTPDRILKFFSHPFKRNKSSDLLTLEPKSPSKFDEGSKLGRLFRTSSQKYKSNKHSSGELTSPEASPTKGDINCKQKKRKNKRRHFTVAVSSIFPSKEAEAEFRQCYSPNKVDAGIQCNDLESTFVMPGAISPISLCDSGASLQSTTPQTSPNSDPLTSHQQGSSRIVQYQVNTNRVLSYNTQVSPTRTPMSQFSQHYSWPTDNETTPRQPVSPRDSQFVAIGSTANAACPRFVDIGSTDSGIQQDTVISSNESLKGVNRYVDSPAPTLPVRRRRYGTTHCVYSTERPSSALSAYDNVMWPDQYNNTSPTDHHVVSPGGQHTNSDLGGNNAVFEAIQRHNLMNSELDTLSGLGEARFKSTSTTKKNRRLSTPHSIRPRTEKAPPNSRRRISPHQHVQLKRCNSAPNVAQQHVRFGTPSVNPDVEASHCLTVPRANALIGGSTECLHNSFSFGTRDDRSSCGSDKAESIYSGSDTTYAEALWDHVTLDDEELAFRAGDQILVLDVTDRDWWWGMMGQNEGWFPAAFVRLKANQEDTAEDFAMRIKEGQMDKQTAMRRYSVNLLSRDQARTNVVNEIIQAEREYVRHLRDVVQGYLEKARRRPEMFTEERIYKIFGNLEEIYSFSQTFLRDLEKNFRVSSPQLSELGQCFITFSEGFEIYSDYCNSHPLACEELDTLQLMSKYQHFFEACRLLQDMIEIPLEGFLLIPVQKICKYPLQLAELLKYTSTNHPDHAALQGALDTMKHIALLINERKRKMESIEKLAGWQQSVQQWEGCDLVEISSELIHQGELTKVNSGGWHQERTFFLFDHQLVYCKKDLLWRDLLIYKGRIDLNHCEIQPIPDGKDSSFNANVKNAWKMFDHDKDKWYLMYAKTAEEKTKWLTALQQERQKVTQDKQCGFQLPEYVRLAAIAHAKTKLQGEKQFKNKRSRKISRVPDYQHPALKKMPSQTQIHTKDYRNTNEESKKHWFVTLGRKFKK